MLEGLIIFALGYVFGKYTDQIIAFAKAKWQSFNKKD